MNDERPIVIVKKKGGHAAHHGGAWKVAYADFVTAMMAFFLVMWIIGMSPDVRKAIAEYFNDPSGFMKTHAGGKSLLSLNPEASMGKPTVMPSLASMLRRAEESSHFKHAKEALEMKLSGIPEFKNVKQYVDIHLTAEGLRIELLEGTPSLFFQSGSSSIQPRTVHLLQVIGKELGKLDNDIVLEGHTDAHPYVGGLTGYSNWELSSDRANAARRIMVPTLRKRQVVEVRGYADHRLRNPEDPYHFSNRRISIVVRYSTAAPANTDSAGGASSPTSGEAGSPAESSSEKPESIKPDLKPNAQVTVEPAVDAPPSH